VRTATARRSMRRCRSVSEIDALEKADSLPSLSSISNLSSRAFDRRQVSSIYTMSSIVGKHDSTTDFSRTELFWMIFC
jgi:hypothetical protein